MEALPIAARTDETIGMNVGDEVTEAELVEADVSAVSSVFLHDGSLFWGGVILGVVFVSGFACMAIVGASAYELGVCLVDMCHNDIVF